MARQNASANAKRLLKALIDRGNPVAPEAEAREPRLAVSGGGARVLAEKPLGALSIRCGEQTVPLPAKGAAWSSQFNLTAGALRKLPARLKRELIEISVFEGRLTIVNYVYAGATMGCLRDRAANASRG